MNLLSIILSISFLLLFIFSFFVISNLTKQIEAIEDIVNDQNKTLLDQNKIIDNLQTNLLESRKVVDDLDHRGILRSDDEIGRFFEYMKEIQATLESAFLIQVPNEEKRE